MSKKKLDKGVDVNTAESSGPDPTQTIMDKCGTCSKAVLDSENGLGCEICGIWYHAKCQLVQDALYKLLGQYKDDVHWYCKACQAAAGKLFAMLLQIQKRMDKLEQDQIRMKKELQAEVMQSVATLDKELSDMNMRLAEVEVRVQDSMTDLDVVINQRVKEHFDRKFDKSCVDGEGKLSFAGVVAKEVENKMAEVEQVTEQFREDRDVALRSNNIILYRIPESDFVTFRTRIGEDRKFIDELCNDALGVSLADDDITNMYRLGRRPDDAAQRSAKPRPLLVTFRDAQVKRRIMANVACLRDTSERYSHIGISHDLTPKQRVENKTLLDNAKQKLVSDNKDPKNYRLLIAKRDIQRVVIPKPR